MLQFSYRFASFYKLFVFQTVSKFAHSVHCTSLQLIILLHAIVMPTVYWHDTVICLSVMLCAAVVRVITTSYDYFQVVSK